MTHLFNKKYYILKTNKIDFREIIHNLKYHDLYVSNIKQANSSFHLYINLACLFVCLFVSNKRRNGWTDRAQIFCGTSRDPREGSWMIEILNICLHQNSISIKFFKILKIHEIFCENPRIIFVFFRCTQREHVHNLNRRWARSALKA